MLSTSDHREITASLALFRAVFTQGLGQVTVPLGNGLCWRCTEGAEQGGIYYACLIEYSPSTWRISNVVDAHAICSNEDQWAAVADHLSARPEIVRDRNTLEFSMAKPELADVAGWVGQLFAARERGDVAQLPPCPVPLWWRPGQAINLLTTSYVWTAAGDRAAAIDPSR